MKNNQEKSELIARVADLSEEQKLDLFSVEELEDRLEMVAANNSADTISAGCDGACWLL